MAYTVERALSLVEHAGSGATTLPPLDYVNEAGQRLFAMRPWTYLQSPPIHLGVRAAVAATGLTWDGTTNELSAASAFATYTHAPGDTISVRSGTNAIVRDFFIEEKVDDDTVRLSEAAVSSGSPSDIQATVNANRAVIMPSNFGGQLRAYATTSGLTVGISLTSHQQLTSLRTGYSLPSTGSYVAALYSAENLTDAGGPPSWRLELWPYPTAEDVDLLTVSYQVAWRLAQLDTKVLQVPDWMAPLYSEMLRAVVQGYEYDEEASIGARIDAIKTGSTYYDAVQHDSLAQPDYGEILGGAEDVFMGWADPYPERLVADL